MGTIATLIGFAAIGLLIALIAALSRGSKRECKRCHEIDDAEMDTIRASARDWKSQQINGQIHRDEPAGKDQQPYMGR